MRQMLGWGNPFFIDVAPPLIPKLPEINPSPEKQPAPAVPETEPLPQPEIDPHETPQISPAVPEIEEPEKNPFTEEPDEERSLRFIVQQ